MRKHRFVADLSDLGRPQETGIVIVAGYAVPEDKVTLLLAAVEKTKKKHCGEPHIPVKWNLRGGGFERALRRHGMEHKRDELVRCSKELRADLLADMRAHGCSLFASAKHGYTGKGKTRHYLADFGFTNILQRFGLFAKREGGGRILLDWPSSSDSKHFVSEYLSAWRDGEGFYSGALRLRGFEPGLSFGITDFDPLLQVADLVVGISQRFIEFSRSKISESDFGVEQFRRALPAFHSNGQGRVLGCGFAVSPTGSNLAKGVKTALDKLKAPLRRS